MQTFNGNACNSIAEAYFKKLDGQPVLDRANKMYIEPLPNGLKQIGAVAFAYRQQKIHIGLNKHLSYEMGLYRDTNLHEEMVGHYLNFHMDFK